MARRVRSARARAIIEGAELPGDATEVEDQPAWTNGTIEALEPLLPSLAQTLGAAHRNEDGVMELRVITEAPRGQIVRLSRVLSDQPLAEGRAYLAAESVVGELSGVLDPEMLLRGAAAPGAARVVLVDGPADLPIVLVQGFIALEGATLEELVSVIQEVATRADALERRIFGADCG